MQFFGRSTHGLEELAWADISRQVIAEHVATSHRLIEFTSNASLEELITLRSVEDLFALVGDSGGIPHTREALGKFTKLSGELNFDPLPFIRPQFSSIPRPRFSITASFLGKRNYNRWEIADTFGEALADKYRWNYIQLQNPVSERVDLHVRVHIEHERIVVGIRLSDEPLYKRAYKVAHAPGSLNPCVGYLLTTLAGSKIRGTLLDPACGVGTIPIEAVATSWKQAVGRDVSEESILKAKENCRNLANLSFAVDDIFMLSTIDNESIDAVVSDLPWGKQTSLAGSKDLRTLTNSLIRISKPEGYLVLLSEADPAALSEALEESGASILSTTQISLFGRHPHIVQAKRS